MDDLTRTAPLVDPNESAPEVEPRPGMLAIHCGRPLCIPFVAGGAPVGRDALAELGVLDDQMSRAHVSLTRRGFALVLCDAGSRNGTYVRGERIEGDVVVEPGDAIRCGRTLFVVVEDVGPFVRAPVRVVGEEVRGPSSEPALAKARAMAPLGQLLVLGESGSGKEHVARAFHEGAKGPFVGLNCATIAPTLAERLLFGARRGAYTGADADAEGHVRAAEGGTLVLDEIAELEPPVQAKLLRFLETKEYFPVGETRARRASVRVCFATLRDLAGEVRARRFREDLYHRIATPFVELAPLRERPEEIPHLIELEVIRAATRVRPSLAFVEAALSARWPGNVRQLRRTVEAALLAAAAEGRLSLLAADLPREAPAEASEAATVGDGPEPSDDDVRLALSSAGGNVSVAARALGIHRSRLRRWIAKNGR
jgi:transcriptional regulator of acetoin/glycerol metabolism